jgi:hypothetical protein
MSAAHISILLAGSSRSGEPIRVRSVAAKDDAR